MAYSVAEGHIAFSISEIDPPIGTAMALLPTVIGVARWQRGTGDEYWSSHQAWLDGLTRAASGRFAA